MKKIIIVALGCLLSLNLALAGEPSAADQKWLSAVEKMVAEGKTSVSTPSKERVDLLKQWAGKKGYTVDVTKSENSYRAKLSKNIAKS